MKEVKEAYEELRKRYNLPSFQSLDNEFEIRALDLEKCGILIKALLRTINAKIGLFLNYLEPVASPSQTMHSMIEVSHLDEKDKQDIFMLYKELSGLYHAALYKEMEDEKDIAMFINDTWKKWPSIKRREIGFLKKISEIWEKE